MQNPGSRVAFNASTGPRNGTGPVLAVPRTLLREEASAKDVLQKALLVVSADAAARSELTRDATAGGAGIKVLEACSESQAIDRLTAAHVNAVVVHLDANHSLSPSVLAQIRALRPNVKLAVVADQLAAVEATPLALRAGARRILSRPYERVLFQTLLQELVPPTNT